MMIFASMTRWPNLLTINFVPLHNPIDWLRLHNKRIGTPTLNSNLWFAISLNYKIFRNSTEYNESIETPTTALAPSFVRVKEFAFRFVCNSSDSDSRIALLTSSTSVFLGPKCCVAKNTWHLQNGVGDLDRWFGLILLNYNLLLAASYGTEFWSNLD